MAALHGWALLPAAIIVLGCAPHHTGGNSAGEQSALSAEATLTEMLGVYAAANSYRDQGILRLSYESPAGKSRDEFPVAVTFARPNLLRLTAYRATVISDGQKLFARIEDPATENVDGQVVVRPAPEEMKLTELSADPLLYEVLLGWLQRNPIQLELLFDQSGLKAAAAQPGLSKLLEPATLAGVRCRRVEISPKEGAVVLWIGESDHLLRRVDYPAKSLFPDLAADSSIRNLELVAELRQPTMNEKPPAELFTWETPADAKPMRSFVVPPRPLPTELFGRKPSVFRLHALDGAPLERDGLPGSIRVMLWFNEHPACRPALQQFDQVRRDFAREPRAKFHLVCVEPESVTNSALTQYLTAMQIDAPVLRDTEAVGREAFRIDSFPALVMLNDSGEVQVIETQGNDKLAAQLPVLLQRVLKGEDLAREAVERAAEERRQYERTIAQGGPETPRVVEVDSAKLAPVSAPKHWRIRQLWRFTDAKLPGNILVTDEPTPRIFVCDGLRSVVELSLDGKLIRRRELELGEGGAVTFLRTAVGKDGVRRFAGGTPLGPQAYLFDEDWKTTLAYPPLEQPHDGIRDVQLYDLDAAGDVEAYIGFWNLLGMHAVSPAGKRLWNVRTFSTVLSMAASKPNDFGWRQLLLTGDKGTLLPVNHFGNPDPQVAVEGRALLAIYAARYEPAEKAPYCALTHSGMAELSAVGLSADYREVWSVPLPKGTHQRPIELITSGPFLGAHAGGWLIAGADGSIHVISDNGTFQDEWGTGETLTGIALTRHGDDVILLTSGDQGVTAFRIQ